VNNACSFFKNKFERYNKLLIKIFFLLSIFTAHFYTYFLFNYKFLHIYNYWLKSKHLISVYA